MVKLLSIVFFAFLILNQVSAQDRIITGRVLSEEDNSPLPGVVINLPSGTGGTSTDSLGRYSLSVGSDTKTLIFNFTGFKPLEAPIGSANVVDVSLQPDVSQLKEVVVTALGVERSKRTLGYSVGEIGGRDLVNSREVNMVNAMAGKTAGVQINSNSGTPGSNSRINIRGNRSFTGENQPLFVIDGVPMDNSTNATIGQDYPYDEGLEGVSNSNRAIDINPDDIESINVLKGPAASALYGVRAANGAVIISTKKGKKENKTDISYSSSIDLASVNKLPEFQKTYAQGTGGGDTSNTPSFRTYLPGADGIYQGGSGSPIGNDDIDGTPNSWGPTISSLSSRGISYHDNVKEFFKTAVTLNNNLSIASGNESSSFRLSIGNTHQNGIVPTTLFNRTSVRLNATKDLSKKWAVSAFVNYINSGGKFAQTGSNLSGVTLALFRTPESYNLKEGYEYNNGVQRTYYSAYDNPYWSVNKNKYTTQTDRIIGNFALNYNPFEWLKFTYRLGTDMYTDRRKTNYAVGSNGGPAPFIGEIGDNSILHKEVYGDLLITAQKQFTKSFFGSITLGNNVNERYNQSIYGRARGLAIANFYNVSNGPQKYTDETTVRQRSAAFFYDVNLAFFNSLYFQTTGRYEYSSTFGPNRRSFFFPSANVAWVFSDLDALNNVKSILSYGKLRVAIAQAANTPPPYSAYTPFVQPFFADGFTSGFSFPYGGQTGYGISNTLGNLGLMPELTTGYEFGGELRFIKDRIKLDVTWYDQITSDIILSRPLPMSSGYAAKVDNGGEITNKGWEILLNITPIQAKSFQWDFAFNFTHNQNKVTKLSGDYKQYQLSPGFGDPTSFAVIGQPAGVFYGSTWLTDNTGKLLIDDAGDPIKSTTNSVIGNPNPKFFAGIRNSFSYKNFTLSGLFDFRYGNKLWNATQARLNRIGTSKASEDREHTFVIPGVRQSDGQPNTTAISAFDYWTYYKSDQGAAQGAIQDGSWIRLRDVSLSYTLKFSKVFFKSIDFTVTGRNLWLYTKYTGVDPETSLTGTTGSSNSVGASSSLIQGYDYFNLPNTKSYNFSIRFNL